MLMIKHSSAQGKQDSREGFLVSKQKLNPPLGTFEAQKSSKTN
jgi:hypothetical protein